eukprot:TRINITY_DN13971_c0_g1_i1.p1 TRINITY_DN13971_c0_g1~~TRINITY_DN13971_c0_g1_i1.p1  ORF type:complete len:171 (-),score=46.88 TRINITY_DN13971_c0_g1_i1:62-574(-)
MNTHKNQSYPVSEKGRVRNSSASAKTANNGKKKPSTHSATSPKQTAYRLPVFLQDKIKNKTPQVHTEQNFDAHQQQEKNYQHDERYLVMENENVHLRRVIDVEQRTSKELLRMLYQTQIQLEQTTEQLKSEHTQRTYLENQLKNSQMYSQPPSLLVTSLTKLGTMHNNNH